LYQNDKKAALDAIARHLGMFPLPARQREDDAPEEEEEDPREFLAPRARSPRCRRT
jgi:hypothetical protein